MMDKGSKTVFSGALILGLGAFIAKLLGAVYRIPLTRIIGAEGLGIYQMIFPVYTLLLDFSGAAVPNAMAKIISSFRGAGIEREIYARKILKTSVIFFFLLGLLFSILIAVFSKSVASAQGNVFAAPSYLAISPSITFVCIICCFRGYFQGFANMRPTAISQMIEQAIKLVIGLAFSYAFMPDIIKAAAGAAWALTFSEAVTAVYLYFRYRKGKKNFAAWCCRLNYKEFSTTLKSIIKLVIPISVAGVLLPLSKVLDSFIIINCIKGYRSDATALFGLFSGVAVTVVGLPVAICYGIASVAVPTVSAEKENENGAAMKSLLLTFGFSLICAVSCYLFAPLIVRVLYGYLSDQNREISVRLLRITSPCVMLLSVLQTVNAVFIGKGKPRRSLYGLLCGVLFKVAVELWAVNLPEINIYGAAYGAIACYFVADLVNLIVLGFTLRKSKNKSVIADENGKCIFRQKVY